MRRGQGRGPVKTGGLAWAPSPHRPPRPPLQLPSLTSPFCCHVSWKASYMQLVCMCAATVVTWLYPPPAMISVPSGPNDVNLASKY